LTAASATRRRTREAMYMIRRLWNALLQLLYPPDARCAGCGDLNGAQGGWLCDACIEALHPQFDRVRSPEWPEDGVWEAFTAYRYNTVIRQVLHAYKFRSVRALSEPLAYALTELYNSLVYQRPDVIVPVPLHRRRLRERGFNQSLLLAQELSERIGVPCAELLTRTKRTRQQAKLSHEQRSANISGAFAATVPLSGRTVMLLDDIVTSGATANECAAVLRQAGASEVWLIAVANASGIYSRSKVD